MYFYDEIKDLIMHMVIMGVKLSIEKVSASNPDKSKKKLWCIRSRNKYGFLILSILSFIGICWSWWQVAHLPLYVLQHPSTFLVDSPDKAKLLKEYIFPELGQFGDMFGGLGVLFAGFGLVGIMYTLHEQRQEQRKTSYITAVAALLDHFTTLYGMDKEKVDEYSSPQIKDSIHDKMQYASKTLEIIRDLLSEEGNFDFEKERKKFEQNNAPS